MSGRLLVHIGLPKTATTALQQDVLPQLTEHGVTYAGVRQPRGSGQSGLYDGLMAMLRGADPAPVREGLAAALRHGSVALSEEMVVVSEPSVDWRTKVRRLGELLAGLDARVLVTVRSPAEALFSYHVERQRQPGPARPPFLRDIGSSAYDIYRYRTLTTLLDEAFDPATVHYLPFEAVTAGEADLIWELLGLPAPERVAPPVRNQRDRQADAVHTGVRPTVGDKLKSAVLRAGLGGRSVRRLGRPLVRALRTLQLGERTVPTPTEAEWASLRGALADDAQALYERAGIDYRASV